MADLRRWSTVLAVLALMAGVAGAQIGTNTGGISGPLSCSAHAAGTPQLRPEGYAELLGDILITCTGGALTTPSSTEINIPSAIITIYISPGVTVTSRRIGTSGNLSEALLLIDDPGSTGLSAPAPGFGPQAPQNLCANVTVGCATYAALAPNGILVMSNTIPTGPNYLSDGAAKNVYQGVLNDFGPQSVTSYGVPVLPPATSGITHTYRITNVRIPAVGLSGVISVFVSTSPLTIMPFSGVPNVSVGTVGPAMAATVNTAPPGGRSPFSQCSAPAGPSLTAQVSFTEGFRAMFKTRVAPLTNTAYASTVPNTGSPGQNIPGGIYGGFAQNSESGFILPALTAGSYTAGLADYGTRLKAVFSNIPSGVKLYVSATSAGSSAVPGGTGTVPYAVLVGAGNTADSLVDGSILAPLAGTVTGSDGLPAYQLTPAGGTAAAIWEVVNSNPLDFDTLTFSVYASFTGSPAVTGAAPFNNVSLSFGAEPGGGSFTPANATVAATNPVPRFAVISQQGGSWISIISCAVPAVGPGGLAGLGVLLASLASWVAFRPRARAA